MNWHVVDNRGRTWYPYILTNIAGKPRVILHWSEASTDMGDMFMEEVAYSFGPLTIGVSE